MKQEYLSSSLTYGELAGKYGLSDRELRARARAEGWYAQRRGQSREDPEQRRQRLIRLTDRLMERLEQAVEELEKQTVVRKTRQVQEGVTITQEFREPVEVGMVDREGLRQIVSALKEVRGLQALQEAPEEQGLWVTLEPGLEEFAQ